MTSFFEPDKTLVLTAGVLNITSRINKIKSTLIIRSAERPDLLKLPSNKARFDVSVLVSVLEWSRSKA